MNADSRFVFSYDLSIDLDGFPVIPKRNVDNQFVSNGKGIPSLDKKAVGANVPGKIPKCLSSLGILYGCAAWYSGIPSFIGKTAMGILTVGLVHVKSPIVLHR